jgi:hypothetical protein
MHRIANPVYVGSNPTPTSKEQYVVRVGTKVSGKRQAYPAPVYVWVLIFVAFPVSVNFEREKLRKSKRGSRPEYPPLPP